MMAEYIKAPKGVKDILPDKSYQWQYLEFFFREKCKIFNINEIRTPIFEHTELFLRGVGDSTDIVQKEMYTFNDKGNRSITLKSEGTSPVMRAFLENSLYAEAQPTKLFYISPIFRYENVQKGRLRQHHQFGVEIFSIDDPIIDADLIGFAFKIFNDLGLNIKVKINSIGCDVCRKNYKYHLINFLTKEDNIQNLCSICEVRLQKNPLRILDCKENKCKDILKNAPTILEFICDECSNHLSEVEKYLKVINIDYMIDPYIVRGLDYYNRTVFEIVKDDLALCGGGRYDNLSKQLGHDKPISTIGFGLGIERLLIALEEDNIDLSPKFGPDVFVVSLSQDFKELGFEILDELRKNKIKCDIDLMGRSTKAQIKYATKLNFKYILFIGEDEVSSGISNIKILKDGTKTECPFDKKAISNKILQLLNEGVY